MTNPQIDLKKIVDLINSGELHSRVIRNVAAIEMRLDSLIVYYFTTFNRWLPFTDLILELFTVSNKVSIIDRLPYKRRHPSLKNIKTLRDIIQARNFFAHSHYLLPGSNMGKMKWLYLFSDYPEAYQKHLKASKKMLDSLLLTNEIAENNPHLHRARQQA